MAARDVSELLGGPVPAPDAVLAYGPALAQVVDLRLPPAHPGGGPRPLVVVVHGGFWKEAWDRAHAGPQAAALAAEGYLVAVPEYRRVGDRDGGWPGTFDDTARWADRLLEVVAAALGSDVVDVDRVVLVGHSAGGHLALWSAARHQLPGDSPWKRATPLRLRGVVALAAVSDLAMAAQLGLGQDATVALMDGRPGTLPDRYGQGDPASLVPSGVPTVLVHGVDDTEVPCVMSRAYATRAREAGDEVELVELPGTGHYDLIDPRSEAWATVSRVIRDMLR